MHILFLITCIGLAGTVSASPSAGATAVNNHSVMAGNNGILYDTGIVTGAGQTDLFLPLVKGKTVALVVNQTSLIGSLI